MQAPEPGTGQVSTQIPAGRRDRGALSIPELCLSLQSKPANMSTCCWRGSVPNPAKSTQTQQKPRSVVLVMPCLVNQCLWEPRASWRGSPERVCQGGEASPRKAVVQGGPFGPTSSPDYVFRTSRYRKEIKKQKLSH